MLAAPYLARLALALVRPVVVRLGPEVRLAADDLARAPARTGLTVGVLALGIAFTFMIAGLISSTERPLFRWMDEAVRADLFVTAGSTITGGGKHTPMSEQLGAQLVAHPAVGPHIRDVLPIRFKQVDFNRTKVLVCSLPIEPYRRHTRLQVTSGDPHAYRRLTDASAYHVVVSDNFAYQHRVRPGDTIELPTPSAGLVRWHVIATIPDYSWNRGTIFMDRALYKKCFGDTLVDSYDLYLHDEADPEAVRQAIHTHLGKEHELFVLTNSELQDHIEQMLYRFYSLIYANAISALAVAFLGVANTLAISVLHRRREIGLLRAVGATRRQIAWSVSAQALLICVLGLLLGTTLGVVMEHYVLHVLMVEEAGYFFSFVFPVTMTLLIAGITIVAAQLAGAAYQPVSEAVAYE
jgi:putative ABC transport system permease protein